MKVLLDECLPRYLKTALVSHEVRTVQESGWSGLKNGELLNLAETQFDVFLTSDQNLRYQQNLAGRRIAIIELPTNTLSIVQTLVPEILAILQTVRPGEYLPVKRP